jgi:sialate O-acetylesterase
MKNLKTVAMLLMLFAGSLAGPWLASVQGQADGKPKLVRNEDYVEVPAIGSGLCVSNAFQTNMVLQRDKPLRIWGWADPNEEVTVAFAGQQVRAVADTDRSWRVILDPVPVKRVAQSMTVTGKSETLTLENILVGDVWVLGGQSNMEFRLSAVDDGELEIESANFPQIRLLTMPVGKGFDSVPSFERLYEWGSFFSKHHRKGDWDICSPETVQEFSGIGYIFGRRLHMATQVPIGLIDASIGGTTVETWTPESVLQKIEGSETQEWLKNWENKIASFDAESDLKQRIENHLRYEERKPTGKPIPTDLRPGPVFDRNRPGYCYAGVIRPLNALSVKGAIFHQGFNNCLNGSTGTRMYHQIFGPMITAWRDAFDDPEMPFGIISLCTASEPQTRNNFLKPMVDAGSFVRESQYRTFLEFRDAGDKNVGFVSSFDLRKTWYHPQIKIPAGERIAKWALATQYGILGDEHWLPPSIVDVKNVQGKLQLTLSTPVTKSDDSDANLNGFAIAGEDRRFFPADVNWLMRVGDDGKSRPVRNVLLLSSPFLKEPTHYRYAWARNPMGNIANNQQVPLPAQRSDDWILEETPLKIPPRPGMASSQLSRFQLNQNRKQMELDDTHRRILEAEAMIESLKEKYLAERKAWEEKLLRQRGQ